MLVINEDDRPITDSGLPDDSIWSTYVPCEPFFFTKRTTRHYL